MQKKSFDYKDIMSPLHLAKKKHPIHDPTTCLDRDHGLEVKKTFEVG
jgi:hypothetical protein